MLNTFKACLDRQKPYQITYQPFQMPRRDLDLIKVLALPEVTVLADRVDGWNYAEDPDCRRCSARTDVVAINTAVP